MVWLHTFTLVTAAEASPGRCDSDSEVVDTLSGVSPVSELSSPGKLNPASQERDSPVSNSCVRDVVSALPLEGGSVDSEYLRVHDNSWTQHGRRAWARGPSESIC